MRWQVIGASVQGSSHVRCELPCQDAFGYRVRGGTLLLAVADGLGSASQAQHGSQLAVDGMLEALEQMYRTSRRPSLALWQEHLPLAFAAARVGLQQAADQAGASLRDYASTLLAAVMTPEGLVSGQVGDGAVVVLLEDASLCLLSAPQRGEYANETLPLTAVTALDALCIQVSPQPVRAAALFTDGLQSLALNLLEGQPYAPFFTPFFDAVLGQRLDTNAVSDEIAGFLASERVCSRTDDDKTLLVAGRY